MRPSWTTPRHLNTPPPASSAPHPRLYTWSLYIWSLPYTWSLYTWSLPYTWDLTDKSSAALQRFFAAGAASVPPLRGNIGCPARYPRRHPPVPAVSIYFYTDRTTAYTYVTFIPPRKLIIFPSPLSFIITQ